LKPSFAVLIPCLLALGLSACASSPNPFDRPPSEAPLVGLMDQPPAITRETLSGAATKTLAVVLSKNTAASRTLNDTLRRQYGAWTVQFNLPHLAADVEGVLSDERLMSVLFAPMRSSFKEVRLVRDIPEGFESGADYVGVLDVDLRLDAQSTFPKQKNKHVASTSLLILDPQLTAGPLVAAQVEHMQETFAKGADGNVRDTLYAIKNARSEMLSKFEADFAAKIRR
jgi:hypothetical protein